MPTQSHLLVTLFLQAKNDKRWGLRWSVQETIQPMSCPGVAFCTLFLPCTRSCTILCGKETTWWWNHFLHDKSIETCCQGKTKAKQTMSDNDMPPQSPGAADQAGEEWECTRADAQVGVGHQQPVKLSQAGIHNDNCHGMTIWDFSGAITLFDSGDALSGLTHGRHCHWNKKPHNIKTSTIKTSGCVGFGHLVLSHNVPLHGCCMGSSKIGSLESIKQLLAHWFPGSRHQAQWVHVHLVQHMLSRRDGHGEWAAGRQQQWWQRSWRIA